MKKIVLLIALLLAAPAYLMFSGAVSTSSIGMILNVMTGRGIETPGAQQIEQRLKLPAGFSMNLFAGDLPGARFMQVTSAGDVLLTRPHSGDVTLLRPDPNNPALAGERITLLEGLTRPSGIDIADGWLYIGESNAVGRVRFDPVTGTITGDYKQIITGLSNDGNHPYKPVRVGPDRMLYVSQGSTCNACLEQDPRRGTLTRYALDGSGEEIYATGLRNSMGLDWAPWNNALYLTDNGRDMLGDDYPPCELNEVEQGRFYGWPYFNGNNRIDPDFSEAPEALAASAVPPVHEFRAHNAPLGIRFLERNTWPADFARSALVALHGSWNRSTPDGYRVVSLHWENGVISRRDFMTGFERDGDIIGRPVDIAQAIDGTVYISDDYAGAIYRVSYDGDDASGANLAVVADAAFTLLEPEWLNTANVPAQLIAGAALFEQYACASCHNAQASSGRINLDTLNQRLQYDQVIERLAQPTAPMPLFPLTKEQRQALAIFLMQGE